MSKYLYKNATKEEKSRIKYLPDYAKRVMSDGTTYEVTPHGWRKIKEKD